MTDRPIIFSAPMVRALLDGRKTQTRRIAKLPTKGIYERPDMGGWEATTNGGRGVFRIDRQGVRHAVPETIGIWHRTCGNVLDAPYQPGDRLWVRENWQLHDRASDVCTVAYAASVHHSGWSDASQQFPAALAGDMCPRPFQEAWRPSIHMPRWASRLTLEVTDIRAQRLQDISQEDAVAEGCIRLPASGRITDAPGGQYLGRLWGTPTAWFRELWEGLHGAEAWRENPWVWALTFTVHHGNIDALTPQAMAASSTPDKRTSQELAP